MAWRLSRTGRVGALAVAAALVGGPGCLTMSVIDSVQNAEAQRAYAAAFKARLARLEAAAATGRVEDVLDYWAAAHTYSTPPADHARALGYLEHAAIAGSLPAQYEYALALLEAARTAHAPPTPAELDRATRGLAMLKAVSTHACRLRIPQQAPMTVEPALDVANWYRSWPALRVADAEAANVWYARSVIACGTPTVTQVAYWSGQDPDPNLWRFTLDQLRATQTVPPTGMSPAAIEAARGRAARWRAAALATGAQFPFPPDANSR